MKTVLKWGAIGFVVLIVIAAIAGGGTTDESSQQANDTTTEAAARTTATTAEGASPPPPPPPPPPAPKAKAITFEGSGGKKLAPFTLEEGSTLKWTNTGDLFTILDGVSSSGIGENAGVPENSQAKSGDTYLEPGEHSFDINATGDWTIRITPGS